ncbi:trans-1,2-dihydrobenzene-1,2-diol dehydrogenase-like [Drosophila tropicalis]|uniref:trans-1,2-dihydrobenzene-1,2-diol dehydrogenase-like n=1 Tax=Drosophila tropicalis TaxID=46794 RepID=UPI0035ABE67E
MRHTDEATAPMGMMGMGHPPRKNLDIQQSNIMSSKLLRWGIASAGKISEDFVIAVGALPSTEHKVQAVAARSLERAQEFARKHEIPSSYGSYIELAQDKDVDVVYIGALNTQHYELSVLMLNHGKHVLCEKSLAMNRKQAEGIVAAAKVNKRFFMEAIWSRFFPSFQYVKELIATKKIGEIQAVEANLGFPMLEVERLQKRDLGGGVIYDLGIYAIQAIQWAFQEKPQKIEATGTLNAEGIDNDVSATLTYSGGRQAHLHLSSLEKLNNTAVITGTKGQPQLIDFYGPNILIDIDGNKKEWQPPQGKYPTNYTNTICLLYEAAAVRQSILAGETENQNVTHADSVLFAEIQDSLRKQVGVLNQYDEQ